MLIKELFTFFGFVFLVGNGVPWLAGIVTGEHFPTGQNIFGAFCIAAIAYFIYKTSDLTPYRIMWKRRKLSSKP